LVNYKKCGLSYGDLKEIYLLDMVYAYRGKDPILIDCQNEEEENVVCDEEEVSEANDDKYVYEIRGDRIVVFKAWILAIQMIIKKMPIYTHLRLM